MAVEIASAYVSIIPTTKGIAAGLEKELVGPLNAAAKKGADEAGATMKKSLAETGKSFTKFGIGALAVAGVIGAGLFKAGQSASDLGESVNAVQVTFGKAAGGILKLGEDAATSVGLSNAAFNGLAVQFSAFATTIAGKGGDVVATMKELTGRAADFASVMNIDVAEAATLFQSGLAGETEPLRKYGIDLSAAAVNAFAAANGIGTFGKELTESEKVTARYQLLMEQTSKTQGDFANTSDSAANATRIAKAQLENASASLGASFTPAIAFAATTVASLAGKFAALNEATDGWIGKALGIVAIAAGVAGGLSLIVGQAIKMHERFVVLKGAFVNAEGGLTKMGGAAKGLIGPLAILGVAAVGLYLRSQHAADAIANITKNAEELSRVAEKDVLNVLNKSLAQGVANGVNLDTTMKTLASTNLEGAKRALELAEANGTNQKVVDALRQAIVAEDAAVAQAAKTTDEFSGSTDDLADSADDATAALDLETNATQFVTNVIDGIKAATERATRISDMFAQSIENQKKKLEDLYGKEYDAIQAKYDFADAQAAQMLAVDNFVKTLGDHKSTQDEVNTAQRAATDAILDQSEKYATLDGAALGSEGAIRRQITSLTAQRDSLAPDSPLRAFLDGYIQDLKNVPTRVATLLELETVSTSVSKFKYQAKASGGWGSGPTLVGEEGPEIVDMPPGSFVHTAAQTRSILSATKSLSSPDGGGPSIVVNNNRRDIGVGDLNQILAMARLVA